MTLSTSLDPPVAKPLRQRTTQAAASRDLEMIWPIAAAVMVCALTIAAVLTSRTTGMVASLWAAAGVGAVAWLKGPVRPGFDLTFGLILAAAFAVGNLLVGNGARDTVAFTLANTLEVTLAILLLRRFGGALDLRTVESFCRFMLAGAVAPPIISGLFIAAYLASWNGHDFRYAFETWWYGHALGMAVVGAFGLTITRSSLKQLARPLRALEAAALLGAVAALSLTVFGGDMRMTFVLAPLMILIAARLRLPGICAALMLLSTISIAVIVSTGGPTVAQDVHLAQLFAIMGCMPALLVAVLLEERDGLADRARADQARAERASEGKSRLLSNVSHEIKSPIGGVIGIAELWRSGQLGPVTDTQAEMSEMLIRTSRQIEALAHDLLDVSRAEAGAVSIDLRPVDVAALLEDTRRAAALWPEAKGVRMETAPIKGRLVVRADSLRLSQVLTNLTSNALKYGRSGGVVTFSAREAADGAVRITVTDLGPGISERKQSELFEPFNRLGMEKSVVEGHGIGLALAKRLVELQKGRIGVDSRPGEGAAFWIELPGA